MRRRDVRAALAGGALALGGGWCANAYGAYLEWQVRPETGRSSAIRIGVNALRNEIHEAFEAGDAERAAELLARYLEKHPDDGLMLYNAACANSRLGRVDEAEQLLRRAIAADFIDCSLFRRDPDMAALRDRPVMRAILAARDAADGLIADRAVRRWRETYGEQYRVTTDADRRLHLATTLGPIVQEQLMLRVQRQADHLVDALFDEPLRHYVLIALADRDDAVGIFESPAVSGHYHHRSRRIVVADIEPSLVHELVHAYHHSHMDALGQDHPIWIREGLATLYERYRFGEGLAVEYLTNDRDAFVRELAGRDALVPWPDLFRMKAREFKRRGDERYAQVRTILMFLADEGRLGPWYRAYTSTYDEDRTGILALERVFDAPLARIEARWRRWLDERSFDEAPAQRAPRHVLGCCPATPEPDAASSRPPPSVMPGRPEPAELALRRGRRAYQAGAYHDAIERYLQVLDALPRDGEAHYELGLAYVRTGNARGLQRQIERLQHIDASLASLLQNLQRTLPAPAPLRDDARPPTVVDPELRHLDPPGAAAPLAPCAPTRGCARPRRPG